jgi:hypothetical protein
MIRERASTLRYTYIASLVSFGHNSFAGLLFSKLNIGTCSSSSSSKDGEGFHSGP